METVKTTYKNLNLLINVTRELLDRTEEPKLPAESKLAYAIKRIFRKWNEKMGEYHEEREDLMIRYASVDTDKNVAKDERGGYKYTPEKLLECNKKVRALFKETEVEIPIYIAADFPDWLDAESKDILEGFVLKTEDAAPV